MQMKLLLVVSVLFSITLGIQASEKIKESPCIKELYKKIDWKVNSPTPELVDFAIQQKLEECQKSGDGTPAEQLDRIIDRAINKKNKKVLEHAVIEKHKSEIIKQAAFSNTMWYFGGTAVSGALGIWLGWIIKK